MWHAFQMKRRCPYCDEAFKPSPYHPKQTVCPKASCQKQRRTEYHRERINDDPGYRDQCRDSQRKWRTANPKYMKTYRSKQIRGTQAWNPSPVTLEQLAELVKNNLVLDLNRCAGEVWLICSDPRVKNTFASAKLIVIEANLHTFHLALRSKEQPF
jgi:hypothetical protein